MRELSEIDDVSWQDVWDREARIKSLLVDIKHLRRKCDAQTIKRKLMAKSIKIDKALLKISKIDSGAAKVLTTAVDCLRDELFEAGIDKVYAYETVKAMTASRNEVITKNRKQRAKIKELHRKLDEAVDTVHRLYDWQNGPPLSSQRWLDGWGDAMNRASALIARFPSAHMKKGNDENRTADGK